MQKLKNLYLKFPGLDLKTIAYLGTPDLLGYNTSGHFFTVELKVTKGNKVRLSPHQIAFHVKHPHNTFILVEHLGSGTVKLFEGFQIQELEACGFKLEACCLGLDACRLFELELEACRLKLDAWGPDQANA